ncbi:MAG: DUF6265 family protein, partial [Solirubrobacteraceae bacterium]|nr:DUF6265 family protein [Solirubrobacteraceae bacterium]
MKTHAAMRSTAALAALLFTAWHAFAQPAETGIQRLAWLQGCWAIATPERVVEEQWMAPRAGTMLGMSRTVRGGKVTAHEAVLLSERGAGYATAVNPSGQSATVFTSTSVGEGSIVFENLQH